MGNSIYQLYLNLEKMKIPDRYFVDFRFYQNSEPGRTSNIKITVTNKETFEHFSWLVTTKELSEAKMDFIQDHIEAMIDAMEDDE